MALAVTYIDVRLSSIWQAENHLTGRPVAVVHPGVSSDIIICQSPEALRLGARTGMTVKEARSAAVGRLHIGEVSLSSVRTACQQVREVLLATGLPSSRPSLSEFALDVRYAKDELGHGPTAGSRVVELVREKLRHEIGIGASVGLSLGRYSAFIAAQEADPGSLRVVTSAEWPRWWRDIRVSAVPGLRQEDVDGLAAVSIFTLGGVVKAGESTLSRLLGRTQGVWLYRLAHGSDPASLPPDTSDRLDTKLTSVFRKPTRNKPLIKRALSEMSAELVSMLMERRSTSSLVRVTMDGAHEESISCQLRTPSTASYATIAAAAESSLEEAWENVTYPVAKCTLSLAAQSDTVRASLWGELGEASGRRDDFVPSGYIVAHPMFGDGEVVGSERDFVLVKFRDRMRWLEASQGVRSGDSLVRL
jgi:nucleotidyltransferase/DNA polymerase involved in DNA repair